VNQYVRESEKKPLVRGSEIDPENRCTYKAVERTCSVTAYLCIMVNDLFFSSKVKHVVSRCGNRV